MAVVTGTGVEVQRVVPLEAVEPNPDQPRKYFDPEGLEELAASIRQHGLLQAIVVRPHPEQPGKFMIIAGERRWRACKLAGLTEVPVVIVEGLGEDDAYVLSVLENVNRRDMTVIEEARAYARLCDLGRSVAEVAELFGKTPAYVQWRLDLLNLDAPLQELAASGQLSRNLAWYLSRLSREGQYEVVRKLNEGAFQSDAEAISYAQAVAQREAQRSFLMEPEESAEVRERRRQQRDKMQVAWQKLEALGSVLEELLETSPEELAAALGPQVGLCRDRVALAAKLMARANKHLNQAAAIWAAHAGHMSENVLV